MTRLQTAAIGASLTILAGLALGSLAWGAKNAIEKSDDLLRRAEEAALFVRGEDPYRDPDMTYPPSAPAIFAPLVAPFEVGTLKKVWLGLNLVALAVVGAAIVRIWGPAWPRWVVAAFVLVTAASKPARLGIGMGQFALIPLALTLVSVAISRRRPVAAGALLGLALAKPTMALPMLGFFLARRNWPAIAASAAVQLGSVLVACAWLRISPVRLTSEWLALARGQQAAGLIDAPTIVLKLFPGSASLAGPLSAGLLAATILIASAFRTRSDRAIAGFCLLSAAFFTYHRPYDLVLLLPALGSLVAVAAEDRRAWAIIGSGLVSVALIWPSMPEVDPLGARAYEVGFAWISYSLLGVISWGLVRGLPAEPPVPHR